MVIEPKVRSLIEIDHDIHSYAYWHNMFQLLFMMLTRMIFQIQEMLSPILSRVIYRVTESYAGANVLS